MLLYILDGILRLILSLINRLVGVMAGEGSVQTLVSVRGHRHWLLTPIFSCQHDPPSLPLCLHYIIPDHLFFYQTYYDIILFESSPAFN